MFELVQPSGTFAPASYGASPQNSSGSFDPNTFNWGAVASGAGNFFNGFFSGVGNLVSGLNNNPVNPNQPGSPYYPQTGAPGGQQQPAQALSMTTWVVMAILVIIVIIFLVIVFKGGPKSA